jgi:hypothetical protein
MPKQWTPDQFEILGISLPVVEGVKAAGKLHCHYIYISMFPMWRAETVRNCVAQGGKR